MRISVIGCGYLGAVHAACLAKLGHDVVGIDLDAGKVAQLSAGQAPFYEPVLDDLLSALEESGRLRFTTEMSAARGSEVHFICVGTPQKRGENAADLRFVDAAVEALASQLSPGNIVAGKSTVPVGTAARLAEVIAEAEPGATLVWNPEFLREGHAVTDPAIPCGRTRAPARTDGHARSAVA